MQKSTDIFNVQLTRLELQRIRNALNFYAHRDPPNRPDLRGAGPNYYKDEVALAKRLDTMLQEEGTSTRWKQ